MLKALGLAAALIALAAGGEARAAPRPNAALLAAISACQQPSRALLEQLVAVDSGTGDAEGLARVAGLYEARLTALGAVVRHAPGPPPSVGDNLVASFTGTGKGRILLIAHLDTVFSRGTVAARPPRWVGDSYYGPGAGDDKAGGVTALCALGALKSLGFHDFARIDLLLNASEETGSFGSRDLIRSLAAASDAAINLERGVPVDHVVTSRKGSAELEFVFTGRAAHSGLEPEKGRNAALEAARVALVLGALSDPVRATTVTVTILSGGDKINVVPDHAVIRADVRAFTVAEFDRVEAAAAEIAAHPGIDGVTIQSRLQRNFPPWAPSAGTEALLARANRLYAEIGRQLTGISVGSSADVAFAAQSGTPSIDGFGMEGGGAHGPEDHADLPSLTPRAYLLARLLMDLGHAPPAH